MNSTEQTAGTARFPDGPSTATRSRLPYSALAAVALLLFGMRLLAPPNLLDQDQERPASYVLDVLKHGNWICQRDWTRDITSKPPLYTWLAAIAATACGRVNLFALYYPGALAGLLTACLLYAIGRGPFGARAAFIGALAIMLNPAGAKQFGLARTDGVFALTVTLAAFMGWNAWRFGRSWTWFWLAAAAATLTKGPLGVVLGAAGLLAAIWERKSGQRQPLRGSHLTGIALFIVITVGWFLLAYWRFGDAVTHKMLGKELAGHALGSRRNFPGMLIYQQPLYYLSRWLPWSILAYAALWRVWRKPDSDAPVRAFERFLFCWFVGGLLLFSLAPHQRADLLWPIAPAAALLAGRELDRLCAGQSQLAFARWFAPAVALGLVLAGTYYFTVKGREPIVRQTIALREMAKEIEASAGRDFPIIHTDDPMTLQVYLNTLRWPVSFEQAAEQLRGTNPVYVAVSDVPALRQHRKPGDPEWYEILRTADYLPKKSAALISNCPYLPR